VVPVGLAGGTKQARDEPGKTERLPQRTTSPLFLAAISRARSPVMVKKFGKPAMEMSRLMISRRGMFHALISHSVCGAWLLISRISAIGTIPGQVRSSLPEASASIAVEVLRMTVYSIPSR
jgi:hypothetical protein